MIKVEILKKSDILGDYHKAIVTDIATGDVLEDVFEDVNDNDIKKVVSDWYTRCTGLTLEEVI